MLEVNVHVAKEGTKFLKNCTRKTKEWSSGLVFCEPKWIAAWDGEVGGRYIRSIGFTGIYSLNSLYKLVKDEKRESVLWEGEHIERSHKCPYPRVSAPINLINLTKLFPVLKECTKGLEHPKWMQSGLFIHPRYGMCASDGRRVFTHKFTDEFTVESGDGCWVVPMRFIQVMLRNGVPIRLCIGKWTVAAYADREIYCECLYTDADLIKGLIEDANN